METSYTFARQYIVFNLFRFHREKLMKIKKKKEQQGSTGFINFSTSSFWRSWWMFRTRFYYFQRMSVCCTNFGVAVLVVVAKELFSGIKWNFTFSTILQKIVIIEFSYTIFFYQLGLLNLIFHNLIIALPRHIYNGININALVLY